MKKGDIKEELMNDLFRVTTLMEELWGYHPNNPNGVDVVSTFNTYEKIKGKIEEKLNKLED
jgi:hypothetical protein